MTRGYYAVLAQVSLGYSPLEGRSVTCYSPVRHFTQVLLPFLVRLACVRHAASVDSEPGSNSRLKPDASPGRRRSARVRPRRGINSRAPYLVRPIEPNPTGCLTTGTFNLIVKDPRGSSAWAVSLGIEAQTRRPELSSNWCASPALKSVFGAAFLHFAAAAGVFARTFRKYRTFDFMSSRSGLPKRHPFPAHRAAQNSQTSNRQKAQARSERTRGISRPGSCNGLFSPGSSLQGLRMLAPTWPNEPASHSLLPGRTQCPQGSPTAQSSASQD